MTEAREVAERYYQSFADGDFDRATALFAPDCVTVTPAGSFSPPSMRPSGGPSRTPSDAHMELVRAVEAGPEVYITGRFKGTHSGDLVTPQGTIPASGNQLDVPFADYFRVDGGTIVEHEVIWDQLQMMGEFGVPSPS